jgi:polyhydroxyalkanoate synthesis repressor PhaR
LADKNDNNNDPVTIKKYANRRLYNTATSSYVSLDHLCQMVKDGQEFTVVDAKSGDDITRSVLTQIIFEEESKGQNLLPIKFLRQLIQFYGDSMQSYVPSYLQISMDQFTQNQDKFRDDITSVLGNPNTMQKFEEQIRQNMNMFEQAIQMFTPFAMPASTERPSEPSSNNSTDGDDKISQLKDEIMAMQAKLDELAKK